MGMGTDTTLMAVPTLGYLLVLQFSLFPLHRSILVTIRQSIMIRVIEFGSRVIGITGILLTVGKESGFRATGNGGRINKKDLKH